MLGRVATFTDHHWKAATMFSKRRLNLGLAIALANIWISPSIDCCVGVTLLLYCGLLVLLLEAWYILPLNQFLKGLMHVSLGLQVVSRVSLNWGVPSKQLFKVERSRLDRLLMLVCLCLQALHLLLKLAGLVLSLAEVTVLRVLGAFS